MRQCRKPLQITFAAQMLGAPTRYRVDAQVEQATEAGWATQKLHLATNFYTPLRFNHGVLYLHRLPLTSRTLPLVLQAKLRRVPIIFDTDDLVWDERERAYNFLDSHYPPDVVAKILRGTGRLRAMMRLADAFVFSTPFLAEQARLLFHQPMYVNMNALSHEQVALSTAAWQHNRRTMNAAQAIGTQHTTIGYFSGQARVHDEDVASVAPALTRILDRYQHARLRIVGGLELPRELSQPPYQNRIEQLPAVDWRALPQQIADVDINIAPLLDNPQRRSKSAVKYLEAAAVGVPTVASRLEPYAPIRHGVTGMLAWTADEWVASLSRLVESVDERQQIGAAARNDVLKNHTTSARSIAFAAILRQVARR